jgi:hypothetical protein
MLLRVVLKKNLKMWKESLPHVEFAYNRVVHSTTKYSPFQIVYGFNPTAPIDLLPLPVQEFVKIDASKRADLVKKIHEQATTNIEKMTKTYEKHANKGHKKIVFESGQLVWVHVTPPNNFNKFEGVTTLQDNNKIKAIENIDINLKDQSKRKQLPTFNLNQRV